MPAVKERAVAMRGSEIRQSFLDFFGYYLSRLRFLLLRAPRRKVLLIVARPGSFPLQRTCAPNRAAETYKGSVSNRRPVGFASWDSVKLPIYFCPVKVKLKPGSDASGRDGTLSSPIPSLKVYDVRDWLLRGRGAANSPRFDAGKGQNQREEDCQAAG